MDSKKQALNMRTTKKIQFMNIVMCQKQAKTILVIHSCASHERVFLGQREFTSWGSGFPGSGEMSSQEARKSFPGKPYL